MYDVSDKRTFVSLPSWCEEVKKHCADGVPVVLVGNKTDVSFQDY